ncbi:uncharacterized protein LOC114307164 isoform X2 [Camellia sinensis]|uniref:uncharacterized protein LOC114307164 isoform X2 n=1 Tax=Camellia sinensis TaxID=4442 RepID=UPI0010367EA6|nr:uncharacterized protein LOC114307164 isoform X2 [Camellia sinensis]
MKSVWINMVQYADQCHCIISSGHFTLFSSSGEDCPSHSTGMCLSMPSLLVYCHESFLANALTLGTTSQHSFYQLTHQVKWLVTTMNSCLTFLHNQILLLTERQHKSCRIRMFPLILSLTRRGCGTSLPSMEHR